MKVKYFSYEIIFLLQIYFALSYSKMKDNFKMSLSIQKAPDSILPSSVMGQDEKSLTCDLKSLNFSWRAQTAFSDYFVTIKNLNTKLSSSEIKEMYKFLDNKTLGYFSNKRWNNFYNLFLSPFIKCDVDSNCLLSKSELETCLQGNDMNVVLNFISQPYDSNGLIQEIIYSLDYMKNGGINLNGYLLLKRIIIGFRQYHVGGYLDKQSFFSALKTSFIDKFIDEVDSEIGFRIALNLMYQQVQNFRINFIQFFEICRIVNAFLSYGVTIGEGYITKEQLVNKYDSGSFLSKLNSQMMESYFSLFKNEEALPQAEGVHKSDSNTLRFEDYANLEFWGNIFTNYTDTSAPWPALNLTGFTELFTTNKYILQKYWIYIGYSNFEDYNKIQESYATQSNISDYDFLTNFQASFLETYTTVNKKKIQTNKNKNKMKSLFELNLSLDDGKISETSKSTVDLKALVSSSLVNYFFILDINSDGYITFDDFVIFVKYLNLYNLLNKGFSDPRGVIPSYAVNYINQFNIYPKLGAEEFIRVQNLDSINCRFVDFLLFFDYMIGEKEFSPYIMDLNKNLVDEIHLQLVMKKLNLYTDLNQRALGLRSDGMLNNYDYDSILKTGLSNKCTSNTNLYNAGSKNNTIVNYAQQLNSTVVDPKNIPEITQNPNDVLNSNSTSIIPSDLSKIPLDKAQENGAGTDTGNVIANPQ